MRIKSGAKGQAMILVSVMLGGLVLSATAIAGLLMVMTLRQASDAVGSGEAFFAADAGVEQGLYCYFDEVKSSDLSICGTKDQPALFALGNGTAAGSWVVRDHATGLIIVNGLGRAGVTERALQTKVITQ